MLRKFGAITKMKIYIRSSNVLYDIKQKLCILLIMFYTTHGLKDWEYKKIMDILQLDLIQTYNTTIEILFGYIMLVGYNLYLKVRNGGDILT